MIYLFKTLALVILVSAQNAPIEQQDITVTHIVKPGESLHSITRTYLGTDILWQDNWRLNPHIENPNALKIGEELTIIKERIIPAEKAKVLNVVNRVEKKPSEGAWLSAVNGDELIQKEGVRTYGKSSALLEFNDESKLKVLEFSQIFLQSRSTGLTGTDSATIEVIRGDAELSWEPLERNQTEITIVTGGTISKPQANTGQMAELRTGLTEKGNSVISVYQGKSVVASSGAEVNVKQGMGVSVKPGQVPPEPTPLLKAPKIGREVKSSYTYTNPVIVWNGVEGAASYVAEVCADVGCQRVLKQQSIEETHWQISEFNQAGRFYFRVGAVSVDEIVGFRSATQALEFTGAQDDVTSPVVAIEITGEKHHLKSQMIVGPRALISLFGYDEQAGLKALNFRWDNGVWQAYTGQPLKLPSEDADLHVQAIDNLGLTSVKSYHFITQ